TDTGGDAENRAPALGLVGVVGRDDEHIGLTVAGEADRRDCLSGDVEHTVDLAVRGQAGDASPTRRCDPEKPLSVDGHAVWRPGREVEDAPAASRAVFSELVHEDDVVSRVGVEDGSLPRRERDAVGVHNPFVENNGLVYGIDAPQLAGNRLDLRVEYRKAERTRVDAPHGVGADVVPSEHSIDGKQAAILAVAHVDDV